MEGGAPAASSFRNTIAPIWHTFVLLTVFAALAILGALAQRNATAHAPPASMQLRLIPLQLEAIVFEWATLAWVWFGVHLRGVRLSDRIGGRWLNPKSISVDVSLGLTLWAVWVGITKAMTVFWTQPGFDPIPWDANPSRFYSYLISAAVLASVAIRPVAATFLLFWFIMRSLDDS